MTGTSSATWIRYTVDDVVMDDVDIATLETLGRPTTDDLNRGEVIWIDVVGVGDATLLDVLAARFGLHPLAMEDVVHEGQRPKVDVFDDHLFLVGTLPATDETAAQQVSLFLAPGLVVTLRSDRPAAFDDIRRRVGRRGSRMRRSGADYLTYALIDAVIDAYGPCVEMLQRRVEDLGDGVLAARDDDAITPLFEARRQFVALRRELVWMREVLAALKRDDADLMAESTLPFLNDCSDHLAVNLEALESGRDLVDTLIAVHTALVGQRMNEIMKVLTIIATIFIPLSFVTGFFGMNFVDMPQLREPEGYEQAVWFMVLVAGAMLAWFWKLGWIGRRGGQG